MTFSTYNPGSSRSVARSADRPVTIAAVQASVCRPGSPSVGVRIDESERVQHCLRLAPEEAVHLHTQLGLRIAFLRERGVLPRQP